MYINSLAEAKALCDAVCTSANAVEIINRMNSEVVLFGPDSNLANYAMKFTEKKVIPIPAFGFCPVHKLFSKDDVLKLKRIHPDAKILAHPECDTEVLEVSDFVGSTSRMYREALVFICKKFIIATEISLIHRMKNKRRDAVFIPAYEDAICVNMKLHTLEKVYLSLKNERYPVKVPKNILEAAKDAVEFMLKTRETQA